MGEGNKEGKTAGAWLSHRPAWVTLFPPLKESGQWGRDYRNYYKGHMDKIKGESGVGGGRGVWLGWGGGMGRKGIYL